MEWANKAPVAHLSSDFKRQYRVIIYMVANSLLTHSIEIHLLQMVWL
jgi:hypothetical protein